MTKGIVEKIISAVNHQEISGLPADQIEVTLKLAELYRTPFSYDSPFYQRLETGNYQIAVNCNDSEREFYLTNLKYLSKNHPNENLLNKLADDFETYTG